jgi:hypothetical protein
VCLLCLAYTLAAPLGGCGGGGDGPAASAQPDPLPLPGADRSAPTILITAPSASGDYTSERAAVTVAGVAGDDRGVTSVRWTSNLASGDAQGTESWEAKDIALEAGENLLTFLAVDASANAGTAVLRVTYEPAAPLPDPPPDAEPDPPADPGPPPNEPPTISGEPPREVVAGASYAFQPAAADADGDVLAFAIANAPAWAQFDGSTGRLSGTPGPADVGTTSAIVISVTDGEDTAALSPFDLTVTPLAAAAVTVSWTAPVENSDGSPLLDLAAYTIYYGRAAGDYAHAVAVPDPGATSHLIENLASGSWFFAVSASDSTGNESEHSSVASIVIP